MGIATGNVLVVGKSSASTDRLLSQVASEGLSVHRAETIAEAKSVLDTYGISVVLAQESLPDGLGFDLTQAVVRQSGHLFVGVALSETLWLPVVERGSLVLGQRALNASAFENEIDLVLGTAHSSVSVCGEQGARSAAVAHRLITPRRRRIEAA